MERVKRAAAFIADALFPRCCVICKEEGEVLCESCGGEVKIPPWFLHQEKDGLRIFSRISYKECAVQKLLHAWKYQGDVSAGEWWKKWITEGDLWEGGEHAVFVPVPLAREAFAERGFNQANELATSLAKAYNGSVEHLLDRLPRQSQAKTEKESRGEIRVVNPYFLSSRYKKLKKEQILPPRVILVDDVATTGSTLRACADVLRKEGIQEVGALTFAFGNDA